MNAPILNRDQVLPKDHWYQIEVSGLWPAGKHADGTARRQQVDEPALQAILNRFNAEKEAAEASGSWTGMLVDRDHLSHDMDKTTEAMAWLQEVAIRNDDKGTPQLWGRLDLTDIGEPAVRNRRFKRFSTEYDPDMVEDLGNGVVRPLRLTGLAFTNRPNNKGGKPISNRLGTVPGDPNENKNDTTENMKAIAIALGLPETATEAEIIAKIGSNKEELRKAQEKEAGAEAEVILNRFKGRYPEEKRDEIKGRLIKNRADTEAMLEMLPEPGKERKPETRIFNRETAAQPGAVTDGDQPTEADHKKAAAIRNRASSISKSEGIPFNQAFSRAAAELA